MFGWWNKGDSDPVAKREIHRDQAAELFMSHCRKEAHRLEGMVRDSLVASFGWPPDTLDLDRILSRPFVSFRTPGFTSVGRSMLGAHCYGLVLAAGIDAINEHVPGRDLMLWEVNRRIIEEDVGPDNVGEPRRVRGRPGRHINPVPGYFDSVVQSQQKNLVEKFREFWPPFPTRAAMVVLALGVVPSCAGMSIVIFEKLEDEDGQTGIRPIGVRGADQRDLEDWTRHTEIRIDTEIVFSELHSEFGEKFLAAVEEIDPFWSTFCADHELTYE